MPRSAQTEAEPRANDLHDFRKDSAKEGVREKK